MDTIDFITKKASSVKTLLLTGFAVSAMYAAYFIRAEITENDNLRVRLSEQVQYAEDKERSLSGIENNLANISFKSGMMPALFTSNASLHADGRILNHIGSLDKVVDQNQRLIQSLTSLLSKKDQQLYKASRSLQGMQLQFKEEKMVRNILLADAQSFKEDLIQSEQQREVLRGALAVKETALNDKNEMISRQSARLAEKEIKIRTAYYVVGTFSELENKDVVEKRGGLVGLGASKVVKTDFNQEAFSQIDVCSFTNIPIFNKEVRLVSNHSSGSYEFVRDRDGNVQWLQITDPDKFWENTKYLVVEIRKPLSGKPLFFIPEQY